MSKYIPTTIPINTLSGGVGRQAQSKRMPTEAEELDNVYCTLEKSVERRLGIEMVKDSNGSSINSLLSENSEGSKAWYHWFTISEDLRFLILLERTQDTLLSIYKLDKDNGTLSKVDDTLITKNPDAENYLRHGTNFEHDAIRPVAIGTSLLLLNTEVKAGFTSDGLNGPGQTAYLKDLDGGDTDEEDPQGLEVSYTTASSVDPKGEAVIWSRYSTYIAGDRVIDPLQTKIPLTNQSLAAGIYGIWEVDDSVTGVVGPENRAPHHKYRNDGPGAVDIVDLAETRQSHDDDTGYGRSYFVGSNCTAANVDSSWGDVILEGDANDVDPKPDIKAGARIRCTKADEPLRFRVNKWRFDVNRETWPYTETGPTEYTKYIPVKDYVYPDPDKPYLGQSLVDLSKLRFPPDPSDIDDRNGAQVMLANLYPGIGNVAGAGKIYYFAQTYGTTTPGYYRVKDVENQPYLHKVRTPDKMSVIDKRRMPMQLDYDPSTEKWDLRMVGWDPRTGGTVDSNPGPSPFKYPDGTARQTEITAMAFYRDRLFLAAGDVLFSSQLGNFDNFWIRDPDNITSTDPIDLSVSSNKYSPINTMIPFNDYLFINTTGDTQFELIGSENQITPFTAEIAPTTFFSTIATIEPQLMGNQIYFFDEGRLYIYFGQAQTNINQAVDISTHVPEYLPKKPTAVTVSPAHNSIFFVDEENPNHIYTYTNRFSGDQVIQNAFFRQVLDDEARVKHLHVFDNDLYLVVSFGANHYLLKLPLDSTKTDIDMPRIDYAYSTTGVGDSTEATYTLPFVCPFIDVALSDAEEDRGVEYTIQSVTTNIDDHTTTVIVEGASNGRAMVFGTKYQTRIKLSEQFVRDDKNNVVNGVLSLRSMSLRHANTGSYKVKIRRRGREANVFNFSPYSAGALDFDFADTIDDDGEFLVRVFGLSHELELLITTKNPLPLNITNIEFRGKFNKRDSLLERR